MPRRRSRLPLLSAGVLFAALMLLVWYVGGCGGSPEMLPDMFRPMEVDPQFTDLEGDPDEALIEGLARLGVMPLSSGYFMPEKPIERGDYIMWVMRARNIFWRDDPDEWIRWATEEDAPTYPDVQHNSHYFPYIQGMVNGGYVIGFGTGDYHYARNLTREHMILIRDAVELGTDKVVAPVEERERQRVWLRSRLEDADAISEEFVPAVKADVVEGDTVELAFGDTSKLSPAKLVTRREAARSLARIGGRTWELALKVKPKWKPLPGIVRERLQEEGEKKAPEGGHEHSHELW